MAAEDWIDDCWEFEDFDFESEPNKVCKYCGEKYLHWVETDKGWRLFKGNKQHDCKHRRQES